MIVLDRLGRSAARFVRPCIMLAVGLLGTSTGAAQDLEAVDLESTSLFAESAGWRIVGDAWGLWTDADIRFEDGSGVIVRDPSSDGPTELVTDWEHGDLVLELEFLLGRGADAALYLQGRYGIQLADSWGVEHPTLADNGAIAPPLRSDGSSLQGHVPRVNAAKAPGLWQHVRVVFEAPRFDDEGRKVSNARIEEVVLNGVEVQEAVELSGPARGALASDESAAGPLMIIADGAIAFRDLRIRHFEPVEPVRLADVRYKKYDGEFSRLDELRAQTPAVSGEAFGYVWDLFGATADRMALEWEGTLHAPRTGEYEFAMRFNWIDDIPYQEDAVPGEGLFTIDGRDVIVHEGADSTAFGRVHLERGSYPFSLAYFKNRRFWRPIVFLRVEGPGMPPQYLNAERTLPQPESSYPPVRVDAGREPYVLRSFAEFGGEKRTNIVSVGDPSGVHYALDLNTGGLLYAWRGEFVDVGSMWTARGEHQMAIPKGQKIVGSGHSPIVAADAEARAMLQSYHLDDAARPVFEYQSGGIAFTDQFVPNGSVLQRRLTVQGADTNGEMWLRVADGERLQQRSDGIYDVDGMYFVDLGPGAGGQLRSTPNGQKLLVPLDVDGGRNSLEYEIIW